MRVVLTRPERDAAPWADALRQRGHEPLLLPLIGIAPMGDTARLRAAWEELGQYAAAMFVSANAVRGFFAARPPTAPWPALRAWATGPGTATALQEAGVPDEAIDRPLDAAGPYDSEALWHRVAGQVRPGSRVLIVRGADAQGQAAGRSWLADSLAASGAQVDVAAAYRRTLPAWDASQLATAQAAAQGDALWLFSSSEAATNLAQLLPAQDWHRARALATHARIAQAVRRAGFGVVRESLPTLEAVVASIESLR